MGTFLKRAAQVYFGLGIIFGGLGLVSYLWAAASSAGCFLSFVNYLAFIPVSIGYGIFGGVIRIFAWLPSLVHWYIYGLEPFWQWLMPGLFLRCGW